MTGRQGGRSHFNQQGLLTSRLDRVGNATTFDYIDPDGSGSPELQFTYDSATNLMTSYTTATGATTTLQYDAAGTLRSRVEPGSATQQFSAGLADISAGQGTRSNRATRSTARLGHLTKTLDRSIAHIRNPGESQPAKGESSVTNRNAKKRRAQRTPALRPSFLCVSSTAFTFDAAGQLLQHTDPLNRTSAWDYDGLGRVTSVTDPLNQTTSYLYDAAGNLLSVTDPLNRTTSYQYDDLYRRTAISDPLAGVTSFAFDLAGNLTGLTDPVGNTTAWDYDGLNRVVAETNELNDARTFTYDAANNLLTRTDRNGRVIEYAYDALHRRVEEQWLDDQQTVIRTLSFSYDAASQLTAAADPAASYDYQYDALGRRTSVTHAIAGLGFPVVLASAYDAASNRTSLSATIDTTADFVNQYTYDALHRMTRIEQSGVTGGNTVAEKRIDLTYDAASQWGTITRYADLAATKLVATSDYTFDAVGRLTALTHAQGATPLAGYTWIYDAANRVTEFTSLLDGTAEYTYDDTDQLTGADYTAGAGLPTAPPDEAYGYDANGNRTMTGYSTGDNNLVLSDGTYDYQYDAEGNRTRRTHIATGEVTEYQWDHRNRLIRVSIRTTDNGPLTTDILYAYDAFNRLVRVRLETTDNGPLTTDTFHVYDGERWERGNAGDHLALVFDGNGDLTNRYLYGPAADQILSDEQLDSLTTPGEVLWPLTDNLGTVRDLAAYDDASGDTTVVNHRTYTAFGQILDETDPTIEHRFAYTAREWDEHAGLYHYRARWYDPVLGRFLSEDPIGFEAGDLNLQRYVGNGVTNETDPSGLEKKRPISVTFLDRETFDEQNPAARHRFFRHRYDSWHFGVGDDEEVYEILGLDPDTVETRLEFTNFYVNERHPYVYIEGLDNDGKCVSYYAAYEGVYNGKPLIGYTFYHTPGHLAWELTGIDKLDALQTIAPYYGLGGGPAAFTKLRGSSVPLKPFKIRTPHAPPTPNYVGQIGEMLSGATKSKTKITINGRNRIPDLLVPDTKLLREVKNVKDLSYTRQLRDFCDYAKQEGYTFELWVRSTTRLSGALEDAIKAKEIILKFIPGT